MHFPAQRVSWRARMDAAIVRPQKSVWGFHHDDFAGARRWAEQPLWRRLWGTTGTGLAAAAKGASKAFARGRRSEQTAQRFLEVLIHRDEAGKAPHVGEISIAAPDTSWYAIDTLDELTYATVNRQNKKRGPCACAGVSAFKTRKGLRYAALLGAGPGPGLAFAPPHDQAGLRRRQRRFRQARLFAWPISTRARLTARSGKKAMPRRSRSSRA